MSKGNPKTANLVIEWSPKGVTAFDGVKRSTQNFESVQAAASALGGRPVIVAVSRRVVFIRTTRVPNAAVEDVRLVLSMRLGDLFPIPPSDLAYDFVLSDNVDEEGRLAIVSAMAAQDLRRMLDEFKSAGFKVQQVIPVAFGSVPLVESVGRTSGAVVCRDDDGIGIDIVDGKDLRYSRISSNIANPAAEVCRTYTVAGLPCGQMIAAGGFNFADSDITTKSNSLEAFLTSGRELPALNLEPPEVVALRAKRARDLRQRVAVTMVVCALGLCGYAYYGYSKKASTVAAQDSNYQKQIADMQTKEKAKQAVAANASQAQDSLDLAFKFGQKFSDVATMVASNVPKGVWLGGLSIERGKRLVLRGVAGNSDQVHAYIGKLSSDPGQRLRNVKLEFTNDGAIGQIPVVQFSISAFPVGNVPLNDPTQVIKK